MIAWQKKQLKLFLSEILKGNTENSLNQVLVKKQDYSSTNHQVVRTVASLSCPCKNRNQTLKAIGSEIKWNKV